MRIRTQCKSCGLPFRARLSEAQTEPLPCPNCDETIATDQGNWTATPPTVDVCAVCGCKHLYRQHDVNRGLGCLLVAISAALVPWTYGLSLIGLGLVDLVIHRKLREAVVCYRCDTVYRDARPGPRQNEFDLLKHDVLKYGKTWQDVDL